MYVYKIYITTGNCYFIVLTVTWLQAEVLRLPMLCISLDEGDSLENVVSWLDDGWSQDLEFCLGVANYFKIVTTSGVHFGK